MSIPLYHNFLSVFYRSTFIGPMSAFAPPPIFTRRLNPPIITVPKGVIFPTNNLSKVDF